MVLTVWRLPSIIAQLKSIQSLNEWRSIVSHHFGQWLLDLPHILLAVLTCCISPWRIYTIFSQVFKVSPDCRSTQLLLTNNFIQLPSATERRSFIRTQFFCGCLDFLAALAYTLVWLLYWRKGAMQADLTVHYISYTSKIKLTAFC